jgi:PTH1 family peptidyl-tRNA hydrolase
MKFLIVGLGNPGAEYAHTRHNIGFDILETLVASKEGQFKSDRYADRAQVSHKGRQLVCIKPQTYMNLSGKAVGYWLEKEGLSPEQLLVVTDDLAIPFAQLRMRTKGSDGGHNGLADIQKVIGHGNWARLRVGIGSEYPKGLQADYVLSLFSTEEQKSMPELLKAGAEAIEAFSFLGAERAMNTVNTKKA